MGGTKMKEFFRLIKRWDIFVIVILILLSFFPLAFFSYQQSLKASPNSVKVAVITVDNKVVKEIVLTGNIGTQVFDISEHDPDINTLEVVDEQIHIKSANCQDQVCVRTRAISKPGQTIVCLPHKLVIEIKTIDESSTDDIIISS